MTPDALFGPLGQCSFFCFMFFFFKLKFHYTYRLLLCTKYMIERAVIMIMGPNNARHIVWAIGECFFFFYFLFFFTLTKILLYIHIGYYLQNT